jgi:hypothetical protein
LNKLIGCLRDHHPDGTGRCAIDVVMSEIGDDWYEIVVDGSPQSAPALRPGRYDLSTVVYRQRALGNNRIRLIEFPREDSATGVGGYWHPNIRTHEKMAEQLAAAVRRDLKWPR